MGLTVQTPAPGSGDTPDAPVLDGRRLLLRIVVGLALLVTALALFGQLLKEPLLWLSREFVEHLGGLGIALGFGVPDTFPMPLPPDPFLAFGLLGGMTVWEVTLWGFAGSMTGGVLGFFLGRRLRHTRWLQSRLARWHGSSAQARTEKYALTFLVIAALSPLPFAVGNLACGALEIPFYNWLVVAQIRLLRVWFYAWLIDIGVASFIT